MSISLLRAPVHPDPEADQGEHKFRFAAYPHGGDIIEAELVRRAYEFNWPVTLAPGRADAKSWWRLDSPHLILDTVKNAEDSGATIVRLYETHGTNGQAVLEAGFAFRKASRANLLEEKGEDVAIKDGRIVIPFRPFEIITLVLEK
jgi:alpha-mannosidase